MKGYRLYAEMPDDGRESKSGSKHYHAFTRAHLQSKADRGLHNNCIAVPLENGKPLWQGSTMRFDAISAIADRVNSPVCLTGADGDYLRKRCVRIDETLARRLHPNLFFYLEQDHG